MKIEIWSDFACPFCYIGKRNFEKALGEFPGRDAARVEWKNFQLMPDAPRDMGMDVHDMLAQRYGRTRQWALEMNQRMVKTAEAAGLHFEVDKMIPTNTFDAHRLAQFAREKGLSNELEEALFAAYFSEGRHIGDRATLCDIAQGIGLDPAEVNAMFQSDLYAHDVKKEIQEGVSAGLQGVPFFVVDRKYAFSGAQPPEVFLDILTKIQEENSKVG